LSRAGRVGEWTPKTEAPYLNAADGGSHTGFMRAEIVHMIGNIRSDLQLDFA